ncbi:hypothetical protein K474DRAFT_1708521 [Panus rudis PR-1116 ss-1]|nr:hypothetical protein K474DRAFT_1708521 [Panus rudis PR-1116 ss-1]
MSLYKPGNSSTSVTEPTGRTEFEILKASHRFLREDDGEESQLTWEEKLAKKYYDHLYREYAVCDLKHYKSGNFSLRWRTEDEVLSGAGETTCGNTRCPFHSAHNVEEAHPSLTALELPFAYVENGESKFALVKVVLCGKCVKKLMWKRNKEKEEREKKAEEFVESVIESAVADSDSANHDGPRSAAVEKYRGPHSGEESKSHHRKDRHKHKHEDKEHRRRPRSSRSRSPRHRSKSLESRPR